MIKFRNPGSDITTQVGIIKILANEFDGKVFDLSEFASAITSNNLITAYGYTGNRAMSLSNVADESRNSTKMNVKMYAEVFRYLGWLSSYKDGSSYPLVVTELGKYVANSPNPIRLYEQCLLGINNQQDMMEGIHYNEHVRFFVCALETLESLGETMYKHELCMGPMSVNDTSPTEYDEMLERLRSMRTSFKSYQDAWTKFCDSLQMKPVSVDNQTRFPVGALNSCGWVEKVKSNKVFPPKTLQCFKITNRGQEILREARSCKDLRLDEFNTYDEMTQDALIRLGFYQLLQRANYDISPVEKTMAEDKALTDRITGGRELLFSPFQTLKCSRVNKALGIDTSWYTAADAASVGQEHRAGNLATSLTLAPVQTQTKARDQFTVEIVDTIRRLSDANVTDNQIVEQLFSSEKHSNQDRFYPLIGSLFRMLGFDCRVSRQGDNGSRMDAIIVGPGAAMPIEIKSPGEEEYISIKAIRQAAENKIILLSRKQYPTTNEASSLVVGYHAPNDRAEVSDLIAAIWAAYGIRIGVISFDTLLFLVVQSVLHGRTVSSEQLESLEGFANVTPK